MLLQYGTKLVCYNKTEYYINLPISYSTMNYSTQATVHWWGACIAAYRHTIGQILLYAVDMGGNTSTTGIAWFTIGF